MRKRRPSSSAPKLQTGIPAVKVPFAQRNPGSCLTAISASDRQKLSRLLAALALVCAGGVGLSVTILYVHGQIDLLGSRYTSFCSINDSINCDRVLSSSYAKLAGVPVAWMSLAAYLVLAVMFAMAARSKDDSFRARILALGAAGILGSLVFSAYMGVVAVVQLATACLLCAGLYAVAILNTALLVPALRTAARIGGKSPLSTTMAMAIFAASVTSVTIVAFFTWPQTSSVLSEKIRTGADVKAADPEFYAWYTSLPKVDVSSLVRDGQQDLARGDKVLIVDFFDLECAHCKKNYLMVKELAARRADQITIVHRHFPLDAICNDLVSASVHPDACRAAEAVECAGLQGKHDEMLDILFAHQGQLFAENLPRLAAKAGLDKEELQRCLDEHRTAPVVLADARAGAKLAITSTPTLFIGGRRISGVLEDVRKYEMAVLIEASGTGTPAATN